jgi:hypothetical protein
METEVCFWLDTDGLNRYEFEFQNTDSMLSERFSKPVLVRCSGDRGLLDLSLWRGVCHCLYWKDDCREPSQVDLHAIVVKDREIGVLRQSEVPILNCTSEPEFEIIGLEDAYRWFECHESGLVNRGDLESKLFPPSIVAVDGAPIPDESKDYKLSDDGLTLFYDGKSKKLTTNSASLIKVLLEHYKTKTHFVHESYLQERCGFDSAVRHVVRDCGLQGIVIKETGKPGGRGNGKWGLVILGKKT